LSHLIEDIELHNHQSKQNFFSITKINLVQASIIYRVVQTHITNNIKDTKYGPN